MKHRTKLSQEQQQDAVHQTQQQASREFSGVEELLRFDAAQTAVPPEIAQRLKQSTAQAGLPAPRRPWWKSLFGQ